MGKILSLNKRASYDYEILEKFSAGISLNGQEVKSIKTRGVSLKGNYVVLKNNEVFWTGANIPAYQIKNAPSNYNPQRDRKLLLRKSEIKYLIGKSRERGIVLLPLKLYLKNDKIKLEFAIAKKKRKVDKREKIKKRLFEKEKEWFIKGKF
jgi:SsrA-binding protein